MSRSPQEWSFLFSVAERRQAQGRAIPAAVRDMPEVAPRNAEYWQCFLHLSSQRQSGFSSNPITIESVATWCQMYQVAEWRRPIFWEVVSELDLTQRKLTKERRSNGNTEGNA